MEAERMNLEEGKFEVCLGESCVREESREAGWDGMSQKLLL